MDEIEILEKQLSFNYVVEQIRYNKTGFSETGKAYVDIVKEFFMNFRNSLSTILYPKSGFSGHEKLREIFEAIEYKKNPSRKDLKVGIERIGKIEKQLENLVRNPEEFYQTKDSSELLNICRRIKEIYD